MRLVAEFTTEPFRGEGRPPDHARAALAVAEDAGLECDFGPLGTSVHGDADVVLEALTGVMREALACGATRVTLAVSPASGSGADRGVGRRVVGGDLDGLIGDVTAEFGGPLSELSRPEKQRAVRLLEERGAFSYRKSAETIAGALGVSRFTVYNYLNRTR